MNAKRPVTVVTKNTDFPSPHAASHNMQCVSLRVLLVAVSWPESTFVVSSRTVWKLRVALVSRRILCLVNLLIFYTDCFGKRICFLPQIKTGKSHNSIIYFSWFRSYDSLPWQPLKLEDGNRTSIRNVRFCSEKLTNRIMLNVMEANRLLNRSELIQKRFWCQHDHFFLYAGAISWRNFGEGRVWEPDVRVKPSSHTGHLFSPICNSFCTHKRTETN